MQEWEYKVWVMNRDINKNSEQKITEALNEYGTQGWELISTIPQILGNGDGDSMDISTYCNVFIFKRLNKA